ncbi:hypothetical protein [Defluviimonas sp. WL0075]|uniref:Uncharacterized protein n=1 Tax=Albidovulum sediminicola TaxID=2984331 RepID=A0ABT2Z608_9RHOB|nr:hypothetical protein [Defluviimonas sp. WL0075]MCV2866537.1 hypothetical protein [Defluviimonas sp. WL0075]
MDLLAQITFDDLAISFVICVALREVMIMSLPDRIAGPGGWLIDTGANEA